MLLLLEADEKMEALKHYFGITQDNELIARGIEIRRHDTPSFIKEFQTELLYTDMKNLMILPALLPKEIIEKSPNPIQSEILQSM
jgi:hypothetical protein